MAVGEVLLYVRQRLLKSRKTISAPFGFFQTFPIILEFSFRLEKKFSSLSLSLSLTVFGYFGNWKLCLWAMAFYQLLWSLLFSHIILVWRFGLGFSETALAFIIIIVFLFSFLVVVTVELV